MQINSHKFFIFRLHKTLFNDYHICSVMEAACRVNISVIFILTLKFFYFYEREKIFSTIFCFFETFFFFFLFSNHFSLVLIQIFFLFQNALICKKTGWLYLFLNSLRKHRKKFKNSQFSLKIFFFFLLSPRFSLDWFVFALDIPSRLDDRLKSAINNTRKYSARCADQWVKTFFFFRAISRSSTQHRTKVTREMNKKEEKCLKKALKISGNFISLRASARATPYDSNFCFRGVYCLTTEAQLIGEGKNACDQCEIQPKRRRPRRRQRRTKNNKIESRDTSKWFYKPRIKSRYFYVYYFYRPVSSYLHTSEKNLFWYFVASLNREFES